jgi:AraC-like DNA-binding protein
MQYRYQQVDSFLSDYVRSMLVLEGTPGPDGGELPLFTNGMPVLICKTEQQPDGSDTLVRLALFGKSTPDCWEVAEQTTVVAYFFKPFVLAALFDLPAADLAGERSVDLLAATIPGTAPLISELRTAAGLPERIGTLDRLLAAQLEKNRKGCDRIAYATDHILSRPETDILPQIAEELQISNRTLQRLFQKYVGISPVHYRRICQFQQSFTQVKSERFGAMADVAFDNGFADQSHFIRAFREFTRTTPQTYLKSGLQPEKE